MQGFHIIALIFSTFLNIYIQFFKASQQTLTIDDDMARL